MPINRHLQQNQPLQIAIKFDRAIQGATSTLPLYPLHSLRLIKKKLIDKSDRLSLLFSQTYEYMFNNNDNNSKTSKRDGR